MEAAPDEEPTAFLDPAEEIVEHAIEEEEVHEEVVHDEDMLEVQHEEVLEEIVEEDGMMYDTDGRVVEYRDMVVYDEDAEVIEEYVEVEDLGNGRYSYVMTDEHGNRRLLKEEEVEAMKKMPEMVEEVIVDPKEMEAGTSMSGGFQHQKRGRFPQKVVPKPVRPGQRMGLGKPSQLMYDEYYHGSTNKALNEMAKVDVEKYVPTPTINRRPLPDHPIFKQKVQRSRKNPPWQEETTVGSSSSGPSTSAIRSPSPINKDVFQMHGDEDCIRFKCPECGSGFPNMERHCLHMVKKHDCQTFVREVDFFHDREFENFLVKVEKATLGKGSNEMVPKRSRSGSSQIFVCNYMNKGAQKDAELVEVGLAGVAERPIECCTAFVQKIHSYECIHVKYCDQHIHYDGNIGFRVPLAVKRRLFEMSFKRLPVPCMQVILGCEAMDLLPHPTRFEEKLKNLSHVEVVELLSIINASLTKYQQVEPKGKKVPIKFDTIKTAEGAPTLVVKRMEAHKKDSNFGQDASVPSTSTQSMGFSVDEREIDVTREEVLDDGETTIPDDCDGIMEDNFLYDPPNDRDPLIEELTETELGVLEAYERDINITLSEEQKKERIRQKAKFALTKVTATYQSLDSATHGLSAAELHTDTINQLREMASYVVELCCQLEAEVKAQFNQNLRVDEIKRDMIAGIAMQERTYQPERRPRRLGPPSHQSPAKPHYRVPRNHDDYGRRVLISKPREMHGVPSLSSQLMGVSEAFDDMSQQQRLQLLREQTLRSSNGSVEPDADEKPIMAPVPDELKAIPWSKPQRRRQPADPNAPSKKRGRPNKKGDTVEPCSKNGETASEVEPAVESEHEQTGVDIQSEPTESGSATSSIEATINEVISRKSPVKAPAVVKPVKELVEPKEEPLPSTSTPTTTTTRTGRIVKPKRWEDA